MNEDELDDFLVAFDLLCLTAMSEFHATPAMLAGAVLARVQHLYLADGQADVEGLIKLLTYSVDQLAQRPKWSID
jgi:hypothetical protein